MPASMYELIWIFLIYAFIGWCTEVSYAALDTGRFVNRGFLNGPVCPVYGCGVLVVVVLLTPLKENLLILFAGSVILTTVIELITGFLLEKIFHNQWWDYSNKPFNFHGYICLRFSIIWGLACTFIMDIIHPIIYRVIQIVPHLVGWILMGIFLVAFFSDLGITVAGILKFNKRLRLMNEIARKLHDISDEIGENIYENVTDALEKKEELQGRMEETKEELQGRMEEVKGELQGRMEEAREELQEMADESRDNRQRKRQEAAALQKKYRELLESRNFVQTRLLKAFPGMKSRENGEMLERLKEYIRTKTPGKKE
jgi:uncharacterized membrane protein